VIIRVATFMAEFCLRHARLCHFRRPAAVRANLDRAVGLLIGTKRRFVRMVHALESEILSMRIGHIDFQVHAYFVEKSCLLPKLPF
jgi:hypothetical protein